MTLNDSPPEPRLEGTAFVTPLAAMVIASGLGLELIATPFAVQFEKLTVPKSASGKIPPEEGASAIHSAEPRFAFREVCVVVNVQPRVLLVIVSVNKPEPFVLTSALRLSPGCTGYVEVEML